MTEEKSKLDEKNKDVAMEKQPDIWAEAERRAKEEAEEAERNLAVLDLKTSNIKELKNFVKAVDSLGELKLIIDKTGIHLWQLDPIGISMVIADLPKSLFSKWNVKPGTMSIYVDKLKDALKSIKNNNTILSIKTQKTKHLLNFILPDTNIEIPYLPVEKSIEKKEPNVEFTTEITVPGQPLKEFISQAKKNYEYVLLLAKNKKLILFCKNGEGKLRKEIPLEKEVKEEAAANFDLDYLNKLVKAADKNTNIIIDMKTDQPIKLRYNNGFNVTYWLAPYVDEDIEIKDQIKEATKGIKQEKASVRKRRLHS